MLNEKALELIREYNMNLRVFNRDVCENILGTNFEYTETLVSDMFNELDIFEMEKDLKNDFELDKDGFDSIVYWYEIFNKKRLEIIKEWIINEYDTEILLDMIDSKIIYHKNVLVCDMLLEDLSDYEIISEIVDNGFNNLYHYDIEFIQIDYTLSDGMAYINISKNGYDYDVTLNIVTDGKDIETELPCSLNSLLEDRLVLDTSDISEIKENECIQHNKVEWYFL